MRILRDNEISRHSRYNVNKLKYKNIDFLLYSKSDIRVLCLKRQSGDSHLNHNIQRKIGGKVFTE
jgi:hypothetical protein